MSLKSSEANKYSWNISAVLIFPFCFASYWQAYFQRSSDQHCVCGCYSEDNSWFSRIELLRYLLVALIGMMLEKKNRFSSSWIYFCLRSDCKTLHLRMWRLFFRLICKTFCVIIVRINHEFIWPMKFWSRIESCLFQRPNSDINFIFAI